MRLQGTLQWVGDTTLELILFIVDEQAEQYVLDNVQGRAELQFSDGEVYASIEFDEFFGNSDGSFRILFHEAPKYAYRGVELHLAKPAAVTQLFTWQDARDDQPDYFSSRIARPLDI